VRLLLLIFEYLEVKLACLNKRFSLVLFIKLLSSRPETEKMFFRFLFLFSNPAMESGIAIEDIWFLCL